MKKEPQPRLKLALTYFMLGVIIASALFLTIAIIDVIFQLGVVEILGGAA